MVTCCRAGQSLNAHTAVPAGASLVAIFNAEAHLLTGQLRRPWPGMTRLDRRVIVSALLLTVVLFVLTAVRTESLLVNSRVVACCSG